jgi:hypothetical protein
MTSRRASWTSGAAPGATPSISRGGFQLVIMICEGAFPLMETDEENFAILGSAAAALEPNGELICTTLNALFPLFHSVKEFLDSKPAEGCSRDNRFDWATFRDHSLFEAVDDSGRAMTLSCNERYYAPSKCWWSPESMLLALRYWPGATGSTGPRASGTMKESLRGAEEDKLKHVPRGESTDCNSCGACLSQRGKPQPKISVRRHSQGGRPSGRAGLQPG